MKVNIILYNGQNTAEDNTYNEFLIHKILFGHATRYFNRLSQMFGA